MRERLKELRAALNINQVALAKRIGVSRAAISRLEGGSNNFTNQMIASICREFGVNEEWFRTGNGDMFEEMSRAEKAAQIVGAALGSDDDFILNTFIALGQLSPAEWELIKKFVDKIKGDDTKSS